LTDACLGGPINNVIKNIRYLGVTELITKSSMEKARIKQEIAEAENRKAILIAEAGDRIALMLTATMRTFIAIGPAAFIFKIFMWDKVIGSIVGCTGDTQLKPECQVYITDPLDSNLWWVVIAVISFYLAYDIAARIRR